MIRGKNHTLIEAARQKFDKEKQSLAQKAKNHEISRMEAKQLILKAREEIITKVKTEIKQEIIQQRVVNRNRVKYMIITKLENRFSKINKLPLVQQQEMLDKLLRVIDSKLNSGALSQKERVLDFLLREVILEKKTNIKNSLFSHK